MTKLLVLQQLKWKVEVNFRMKKFLACSQIRSRIMSYFPFTLSTKLFDRRFIGDFSPQNWMNKREIRCFLYFHEQIHISTVCLRHIKPSCQLMNLNLIRGFQLKNWVLLFFNVISFEDQFLKLLNVIFRYMKIEILQLWSSVTAYILWHKDNEQFPKVERLFRTEWPFSTGERIVVLEFQIINSSLFPYEIVCVD